VWHPHQRHCLVLGRELLRHARRWHHQPSPRPDPRRGMDRLDIHQCRCPPHLRAPFQWHRMVLGRKPRRATRRRHVRGQGNAHPGRLRDRLGHPDGRGCSHVRASDRWPRLVLGLQQQGPTGRSVGRRSSKPRTPSRSRRRRTLAVSLGRHRTHLRNPDHRSCLVLGQQRSRTGGRRNHDLSGVHHTNLGVHRIVARLDLHHGGRRPLMRCALGRNLVVLGRQPPGSSRRWHYCRPIRAKAGRHRKELDVCHNRVLP